MLPFEIHLTAGESIQEQIVFAVKRAIAIGVLRDGDDFPSVRTISKDLAINPNTVQKVVRRLSAEGIIEIYPGRGCKICTHKEATKEQISHLLDDRLHRILIEARQLGISKKEFTSAVTTQWTQISDISKGTHE